MSDRYASLNPASLTASIASLPRRWKEALRVPAPDNIDDVLTVEGPDGTVAEHLGAAIAQIRILRDAVRTTSYNVPEPLGAEVATAAANRGSGPWPETTKSGLSDLTNELEALLEQLKGLKAHDWNKSADADRTTLSVLQLAQGCSRVGAERLAVAERTIAAVTD